MTPLTLHLFLSCCLSALILIGCAASKELSKSEAVFATFAVTQLVTAYLIQFG